MPSGEKASPVIAVRCCLKEGRKHGKREEKKEPQTEGTVVMLSVTQENKLTRNRAGPHCAHPCSIPGQPTLQLIGKPSNKRSAPAWMEPAPSPFGAASKSHTGAHKGSLPSCSLGQALCYCCPLESHKQSPHGFHSSSFHHPEPQHTGVCLKPTQLGPEACQAPWLSPWFCLITRTSS